MDRQAAPRPALATAERAAPTEAVPASRTATAPAAFLPAAPAGPPRVSPEVQPYSPVDPGTPRADSLATGSTYRPWAGGGADQAAPGRRRFGRKARLAVVAGAGTVAAAVALTVVLLPSSPAAKLPAVFHPTPTVAGVLAGSRDGVTSPTDVAVDREHAWVINWASYSVSELNARTGALVRVLPRSEYGFFDPQAIADDGTHVWVTNTNNTVSASDGDLIRTLPAAKYGFYGISAIVADGNVLWVVNEWGNFVSEINASTGARIRTLGAAQYHLNHPVAMTVAGDRAWIVNSGDINAKPIGTGSSITELSLG